MKHAWPGKSKEDESKQEQDIGLPGMIGVSAIMHRKQMLHKYIPFS